MGCVRPLVGLRRRAGKALLQISEGKDPGAENTELRASSTSLKWCLSRYDVKPNDAPRPRVTTVPA